MSQTKGALPVSAQQVKQNVSLWRQQHGLEARPRPYKARNVRFNNIGDRMSAKGGAR